MPSTPKKLRLKRHKRLKEHKCYDCEIQLSSSWKKSRCIPCLQKETKREARRIRDRGKIPVCIACGSADVVKCGKRTTQMMKKQSFRCNNCKRRFIDKKDSEKPRGGAKITNIILDLHSKGLSSRRIEDHLKKCHNLYLDHSSIIRRINIFSKTKEQNGNLPHLQ